MEGTAGRKGGRGALHGKQARLASRTPPEGERAAHQTGDAPLVLGLGRQRPDGRTRSLVGETMRGEGSVPDLGPLGSFRSVFATLFVAWQSPIPLGDHARPRPPRARAGVRDASSHVCHSVRALCTSRAQQGLAHSHYAALLSRRHPQPCYSRSTCTSPLLSHHSVHRLVGEGPLRPRHRAPRACAVAAAAVPARRVLVLPALRPVGVRLDAQ
eukprot:scaffold38152_cov31-Phaeocystis_antarctica.AAC.1